jgi:hypothetical protein
VRPPLFASGDPVPEVFVSSAGANVHTDSSFFMSGPSGPLIMGWSTASVSGSLTMVNEINELDGANAQLGSIPYHNVISADIMRAVLLLLSDLNGTAEAIGINVTAPDVFLPTNVSNDEFLYITGNFLPQGLIFTDNTMEWASPDDPVCLDLLLFDFQMNFHEQMLGSECSLPDHIAYGLTTGTPIQLMEILGIVTADETCADFLFKHVNFFEIMSFYTGQALPINTDYLYDYTFTEEEQALQQFLWHLISDESMGAGFSFFPCLSFIEPEPIIFRRRAAPPDPGVYEPFLLDFNGTVVEFACEVILANPSINSIVVDNDAVQRDDCDDPDFGGGGETPTAGPVPTNVRGATKINAIVYSVWAAAAVVIFIFWYFLTGRRRQT